jgi:ABC-type Fe3+-hydroxamate transport system substrate-binding protein
LIIGNKEENYEAGIAKLNEFAPVWMSDIVSIEDAMNMIMAVGSITQTQEKANALIDSINTSLQAIFPLPGKKVLYLIWQKPWMAVAQNSFINSMLSLTGLQNCLTNESRYPELSDEQISELSPDYIFLSSEPYPFGESHIRILNLISPASKIVLVDGEMFSWYGSRLAHFATYFNKVLRPQLV